jgi:hypothetical protein
MVTKKSGCVLLLLLMVTNWVAPSSAQTSTWARYMNAGEAGSLLKKAKARPSGPEGSPDGIYTECFRVTEPVARALVSTWIDSLKLSSDEAENLYSKMQSADDPLFLLITSSYVQPPLSPVLRTDRAGNSSVKGTVQSFSVPRASKKFGRTFFLIRFSPSRENEAPVFKQGQQRITLSVAVEGRSLIFDL